MAYRLTYSDYAGNTASQSPPQPTPAPTGPGYRLKYSDYPGTAEGPPDPARWTGPPGPAGPAGPPGPAGPSYILPTASTTVLGGVKIDGSSITISDGTISAAATSGGPFLPLTGGTVTGRLELAIASILSGASATAPIAFWDHLAVSGVAPAGLQPYNQIGISDTVDVLTNIPGGAPIGAYIIHNVSPPATGGRNAMTVQLNVTGPTLNFGTVNPWFAAFQMSATSNANGGGTSGQSRGALISYSWQTTLNAGATYYTLAEGFEGGCVVNAGASVDYINGGKISIHGQQGRISTNILALAGDNAMAKFGLVFQSLETPHWPIDPAGTIIGTQQGGSDTQSAAYGVDFTAVTFSTAAFRSQGFWVDGAGTTRIGRVDNTSPTPSLFINSTVSGTAAGPAVQLQWGGVTRGGLFGYSAYVGGAFDSRTTLSGYDGLVFLTNNTIAATIDTARNFSLTAGLAVAGTVSGVGFTALLAPYAPLASPVFTGTPTLPTGTIAVTQAPGTSNTTPATTAFVGAAVTAGTYTLPTASTTVLGGVKIDGTSVTIAGGVISAALPVASSTTPGMDGTATIGVGTTWARADHIHPTDTSRYAVSNPSGYQTAAQVTAVLPVVNTVTAPLMDGTATIGTLATYARPDHIHPTDTSRAPTVSPTFTGTVTAAATNVGAFTSTGITASPISGSTGSFTTLAASSTVSGAGFSTWLASPPAIGGTAAAAGSFTTLSATSTVSGAGFTTLLSPYLTSATATSTYLPLSGGTVAGINIGSGAGAPTANINGANAGTGAGPALSFQYAGLTRGAVGGYSAMFGGAFDSRTTLSGFDGLVFMTNNTVAGTVDTAHNFSLAAGLTVAGSASFPLPAAKTGTAYTVAATDCSLVLAPTGTFTLTLPAASSSAGRIIRLKLTAAFAVNSASSNIVQLVGGAATAAIMPATTGKFCLLQSDGTSWQLMEAN